MVKTKVKNQRDWYSIIPIAVFAGLVPLIVRLKVTPMEQSVIDLYLSKNTDYDFFSYYKSLFIILCALTAVGITVYKYYRNEISYKKTWLYIPIAVYIVFVVLSAVFSEHNTIAVFGFPNRYEGMLAISSYIIMMLFVINYVKSEEHVNLIIKILFISASIVGVIGIFQFFGQNFLDSEFGKALITPLKYIGKLQVKNKLALYAISSTLFNQNFVGSYMAMLLSLAVTSFLMIDKKYKIAVGLFSCLMFANLIGSRSRAGLMGIVLAMLIIAVGARKYIIKYWVYAISLVAAFVVIYVSMNAASGGILWGRVETLQDNIEEIGATDQSSQSIQDFSIEKDKVSIVEQGKTLNMLMQEGKLVFKDTESNIIGYEQVPDKSLLKLVLLNKEYDNYRLTMSLDKKLLVMMLKDSKYDTRFLLSDDGFKLVDPKNKALEIKSVEKIDVKGKERMGSSRVYLWSRSIPIMSRTMLLGKGSDTFPFYFPQNDYIGKFIALGSCYRFVEKPHNMYIQMGIDSGVISLLAFLVLLIGYSISSIKLYYKIREPNTFYIIGLGAFAAVAGYAAAGMFNDSLVSVAPVFWTLLGLGIAANIILAHKPAAEPAVESALPSQASNKKVKKSKAPAKR
jgi:O-antigen ligase